MALPGPPPPNSSKPSSMRDRDLAPATAVAAIVCCGGMALVAGLVGGVAVAAIGQFTAVTVVGLGLVILIARRLDRRRNDRTPAEADATVDRPARDQEMTR